MDDAKKAGRAGKQGPWSQYPQRMRQMRARAWAMRDGFAEVLKGIGIAEEVRDFPVGEGGEVQAMPLTRAMTQQHAEEVDDGLVNKGVGAGVDTLTTDTQKAAECKHDEQGQRTLEDVDIGGGHITHTNQQ